MNGINKMTKEEAINNLKDLWNEVYNEDSDGYIYAEAIDMAIEALQFTKHFDLLKEFQSLQEVVRCKDCRFNKYPSNDLCLIKKAGIYPDDDDFCSYGERRKP